MNTTTRSRALLQEVVTVAVMTVLWCLLWGNAHPFTVVGGAVISWLLTVIFYLPPLQITGRLHLLSALWAFAVLTVDIVRASLTVAAQALWPWWHPVGAVVRMNLHSNDDLIITLTAESISLVPGSLVVDIDRNNGVLYVHTFGTRTRTQIEHARAAALAQEERIIMALGTDADRAAVREMRHRRRA